MKINLNKFLLASIGILTLSTVPMNAEAADFSWGKAEKNDNITKIPVILKVEEGESIAQAKFGCEVNSTEATCTIEVNKTANVYGNEADTSTTFTYPLGEDTSNPIFPVGETTLANVVITNGSSARLTNLQVKLINASIGSDSKEDKTILTEVGPKKEEKPASNDARFSNIKFSQGTMYPAFNADITEYTVYNIADTINSVRITPTCNEGECDFDINGGKSVSGYTVTLNQGENTVNVVCTSEDETTELTYTFKVIRGETSFNSPKLKSLSFGDYTLSPAFSEDVREYTLTVPNQITSLSDIIKYESLDKQAKVSTTGLDNFIIGENTLTITVDNQSGEETYTYTITVKRMNEQDIEVIKYIDNIVTFKDSDGIENTMEIEKFKTEYPDEYEKIIDGTYKFDENGNLKTEEIIEDEKESVEDKEEKKDSKTWLIILLIVVGILIIGISGFFIFKKKKPKKIEEESNNEEIKTPSKDDEELDETGIEEEAIGNDFAKDMDTTVDIDEALSDLMSTKQYEFGENKKQD